MATKKEMAVQFLHDLGTASPSMLKNLTDDAEYHVIGQLLNIGPFVSKKVIGEQWIPMLAQLFSKGLAFTIRNVIAEGAFVAVECSSYADVAGGKVYANRYIFLFEFVGDKIKIVKEYADTHYAKETLMPG